MLELSLQFTVCYWYLHCMLLVLALYAVCTLFLPAHTPILVLIACTQTNTTHYVVVSGVELISDTFTVPTSVLCSADLLGQSRHTTVVLAAPSLLPRRTELEDLEDLKASACLTEEQETRIRPQEPRFYANNFYWGTENK